MNQVNIVCRVDEDDSFRLEGEYIDYNINNNEIFTFTFWRRELESLPRFFPVLGLDMFYISLFVFGADRIISRESAFDCWTRKIKLYLPVLGKEEWEANKALVEEMLNFLSGDLWELEFRERELTKEEKTFKIKMETSQDNKLQVNKVCMFSGGLDSFIGVIDLMEKTNKDNILFVSHYGGGKGVKEYQDYLRNKLITQYNLSEDNFLAFYASAKNGIEDTTRTRSLMFFCHAIAIASTMNQPVKLVIPENGLISLNVPLTNSRLGSSSTRTTHPYYFAMLQQLLINLNIDIHINNPYQFITKGEMIMDCKNALFLKENLTNTMSCSHPDQGRMYGESETSHCGYCLPCVIRRSAIKRSGFSENTRYRDLNFSGGETARVNYSSYALGLQKYDNKFSFLKIQASGPINKDVEKYADLYSRGMKELQNFLEVYNEKVLS